MKAILVYLAKFFFPDEVKFLMYAHNAPKILFLVKMCMTGLQKVHHIIFHKQQAWPIFLTPDFFSLNLTDFLTFLKMYE